MLAEASSSNESVSLPEIVAADLGSRARPLTDPASVSLPLLLAELTFLHLAGGGLGQLGDLHSRWPHIPGGRSFAKARMSSSEALSPGVSSTKAWAALAPLLIRLETTATPAPR